MCRWVCIILTLTSCVGADVGACVLAGGKSWAPKGEVSEEVWEGRGCVLAGGKSWAPRGEVSEEVWEGGGCVGAWLKGSDGR